MSTKKNKTIEFKTQYIDIFTVNANCYDLIIRTSCVDKQELYVAD